MARPARSGAFREYPVGRPRSGGGGDAGGGSRFLPPPGFPLCRYLQ